MWDYSDHKAPTQFICALGQLRSTYKKIKIQTSYFFHREGHKQLPRGQTETLGCEAILDFLRKFKRLQSAAPFLNLSVRQGSHSPQCHPQTSISLSEFHTWFFLDKNSGWKMWCQIQAEGAQSTRWSSPESCKVFVTAQGGLLKYVRVSRILLMKLPMLDIATMLSQYLQSSFELNL